MWLKNNSWHEAKRDFAGWGAIAHVNIKTGILTIARDRAMLYCAKRAKDAGWVFATKKEHLVEVCGSAGVRLQHEPLLLPDHKLLSFNERGAVVSIEHWAGFGERQLTYLDTQSWGNSDKNERLHEPTGKKGRRHGRGTRQRKSDSSHPSLWGNSDFAG
jgi:hypothetical protein